MSQQLTQQQKAIRQKVILLSKEMLIALTVFTVSLLLFIIIAYRVFLLDRASIDEKAFAFTKTMVNETTTQVMLFFTFLGSHYFLIPANVLLLVYFLVKKNSRYSIKISAIALSSLLIMLGLKLLFNRSRPLGPLLEPARGLSFPSGHSFMSVCFYGLLMIIIWKEEKQKPGIKWMLLLLLLLIIATIAFSRVYLRVHYFTDVSAGLCVGACWLVISSFLLNKIRPPGLKKD